VRHSIRDYGTCIGLRNLRSRAYMLVEAVLILILLEYHM